MDQLTRKYLILFRLDSHNLLSRLSERREEYLEIFALRRTREHFEKIFFTRYYDTKLSELSVLPEEVIQKIYNFYTIVDDLHWYLYSTQNMPGAVGDELDRYLAKLERSFNELDDLIKEELGIEDVPDLPVVDDISENIDEILVENEFENDETSILELEQEQDDIDEDY